MKLTPLDIIQRQFSIRFRGFDKDEVAAFLQEVAGELAELIKEMSHKEERLSRLEEELAIHQERERELQNTLVTAQRLTEELKENAKRQAELLIKEAEVKAERLLAEAQARRARVEEEIIELKRQKGLFKAQIRAAIKVHEQLLGQEGGSEENAGPQARR